jgi:hypothetical protein
MIKEWEVPGEKGVERERGRDAKKWEIKNLGDISFQMYFMYGFCSSHRSLSGNVLENNSNLPPPKKTQVIGSASIYLVPVAIDVGAGGNAFLHEHHISIPSRCKHLRRSCGLFHAE